MKKKRVAIVIIILILVIFGLLAYFSPTLKINGNTVDSSVKPAANAALSTSNSKVSANAQGSSAKPAATSPAKTASQPAAKPAANAGSGITLENFPSYLVKQAIIKELPKSAQISLVLSDVGKSYIVTTGSVKEGQATKPDIIVTIPSKYVLDSGDFCSLVKLANSRRDLSYELKVSKVSLLWKYSGMMKYKSCF